ncbi:MAG: hypothetical protein ACYSUY_07475 [Planctomycetota bacterium]|jgi:hypothetical protein
MVKKSKKRKSPKITISTKVKTIKPIKIKPSELKKAKQINLKKKSIVIDIVQSLKEFESFSESIIKLESDIRKDDRLAVIIFYACVDSVLDFLVEELFGHEFFRMPFANKVYILDGLGVIDNKIMKNLVNLGKLRNAAAHKPKEKLEWKNKFAFDKNSVFYKVTIEKFGKPKDLLGHLYLVWNIFLWFTVEYFAQWKFGKIVNAQEKFIKNNK